jgi:3-hydroxy-3-methylglutaryl CoA synthase
MSGDLTREYTGDMTKSRVDETADKGPIGIHRMALVSAGTRINADELAKGITVGMLRRGMAVILEDALLQLPWVDKVDTTAIRNATTAEGIKEAARELIQEEIGVKDFRAADKMVKSLIKFAQEDSEKNRKAAEETARKIKEKLEDPKRERLQKFMENFLSAAKPFDPRNITDGIGVKEIRLPGYSEGNITYTANALYKFFKSIGDSPEDLKKLMAEPIDRVFYATESNSDHSLPDVMIALKMVYSRLLTEDEAKYRPIVEMLKRAEVSQETFACVAGMSGINSAVDRIRSRAAEGKGVSALVITCDTAFYDPMRAATAEQTQGAAASLMWITSKPKLVELTNGIGSHAFNIMLPDFTKYGSVTPFVHSELSKRSYVYTVGKTVIGIEDELKSTHNITLDDIGLFLSHVPFPKMAIYFSTFLFAHYLKKYNPTLLADIEHRKVPIKKKGVVVGEKEIGSEPLGKWASFTNMVDGKLMEFNRDGKLNDADIISHIEKDEEIGAWWDWAITLREVKEYKAFKDKLHITEALELGSIMGNSYTTSVFASLASVLSSPALDDITGKYGIIVGYGSGAQAIARPVRVVANARAVKERLIIDLKATPIGHEQYLELHPRLILGEAERMTTNEDLVAKNKRFLRGGRLKPGFNVIKRRGDTTGEYTFVEDNGKVQTDSNGETMIETYNLDEMVTAEAGAESGVSMRY